MTEPHGAARVKVVFDLPREDDDWPPAGTEGLWAAPLPERGHVRLDNIPWFARDVALGDVFRVQADDGGVLRAVEKVAWSGACTVRLIVFRAGPLAGDLRLALDMFAPLGVDGEGVDQFGMVALSVPPAADLAAVKRLLDDGQADGSWEYEEGCVGDAWAAVG